MLIERGVDVMAQNNNRETLLLHLASTPSYFAWIFQAKHAELARIILMFGVDVNVQNRNELTPPRLAQQGRLAEIERILFQHGNNFVAHDNTNQITSVEYKYGFCSYCQMIELRRKSCGTVFALDRL
jgi:hypothetical protein